MIGNYLMVALRNIARHKLYSVINIAGLAVALACVIFIMLFVRDELSYDKWIPGTQDLYRVDAGSNLPGRPTEHFALAPFPLPAFMKDHLPEVTAITRLWTFGMTVKVGNRQFRDEISEADPNLFTMLGLPLVNGDPGQVLQRPESIVLSQSLAKKYFGNADPVGKQVVINKSDCDQKMIACPEAAVSLRVTGVMADLPHNTQFRIDAVIPQASPVDRITEEGKNAWFNFNGYGYVRLASGADPAAVMQKLHGEMDRLHNVSPVIGSHTPASQVMPVTLVPFSDVHMNTSNEIGNRLPPGSWTTVYGLGLIGLVILLAACFNFTNLATARAMTRAREIGLRKCVGASRRQIAIQFLGESMFMAMVALVIALAIVEMVLPTYDAFLQRPIELHYLQDWPLLAAIFGTAIAAGLISGVYPALVLSGFRPIAVLRSNQSGEAGASRLRTVLVVLQFSVSIALAAITMVVFTQIDFVRNQALGFRHDNTVLIETSRGMTETTRESFMAQLRAHPGIAGVAASGEAPLSPGVHINSVTVPGQSTSLAFEMLQITPRFLDLYDMKLAAGRTLSHERAEDEVINSPDFDNAGHNILINETAARNMGFSVQGAVGQTIRLGTDPVHIVGVLRDVQFRGARQGVRPTVYINDKIYSDLVSVRLTGQDIPGVLTFIDRTWHRMAPSVAILRSFLDDNFERLYQSDEKQGALFGIFVGIAILISTLGLFGLAAFTASRRTREIGIRKVFGARTRDVALLLLWQFSIPVLLANLIAWPVAWYYLHHWLEGFAYRITLSPLYFVAAGLAALLIAWATIFAHAWRVARANPVHALRTE